MKAARAGRGPAGLRSTYSLLASHTRSTIYHTSLSGTKQEEGRGMGVGRGGGVLIFPCLSLSTIDYASLWRRSPLPTPSIEASNIEMLRGRGGGGGEQMLRKLRKVRGKMRYSADALAYIRNRR